MADNNQKPKEKLEEKAAAEGEPRPEGQEEKPAEDKKPEKPSVKLDKKLADLAEKIEDLNLAEAAQLAKALQEKFGISAAPVATATPTAAAPVGESAEAAPEQTTFNVILSASGANKISVIKALREINPQLGLKEAKDITDSTPKEILTGVNRATADEAKQKLEAAGAVVELK